MLIRSTGLFFDNSMVKFLGIIILRLAGTFTRRPSLAKLKQHFAIEVKITLGQEQETCTVKAGVTQSVDSLGTVILRPFAKFSSLCK